MIEDVVSRLEAVYSKAHGDGWAYAVPEDLRALLDAYREATKPWAGDKPLAADDEIRLAHPTVSKNHDRYAMGRRRVQKAV